MINYVVKTIEGIETKIPTRFTEGFYISLDDFKYLNKLYKFKAQRDGNCWIDNKHNKTVAFIDKNLLTDGPEICFSKHWLAHECIITKSRELLKILKKYPENGRIFYETCEVLQKIKDKDDKYIAKGWYEKKPSTYFEADEIAEEMNDEIISTFV